MRSSEDQKRFVVFVFLFFSSSSIFFCISIYTHFRMYLWIIKYNDDNSRCFSFPQLVNDNSTHTYIFTIRYFIAWIYTFYIYTFLFTNKSIVCWSLVFFLSCSFFLSIRFMCVIHLHNTCMKMPLTLKTRGIDIIGLEVYEYDVEFRFCSKSVVV